MVGRGRNPEASKRRATQRLSGEEDAREPIWASEGFADPDFFPGETNDPRSMSPSPQGKVDANVEAMDESRIHAGILVAVQGFEFGVSKHEELGYDLPAGKPLPERKIRDSREFKGDVIPIRALKRELPADDQPMGDSTSFGPPATNKSLIGDRRRQGESPVAPANDPLNPEAEPQEASAPLAPDEASAKGFNMALQQASNLGSIEAHKLAEALTAYQMLRKQEE